MNSSPELKSLLLLKNRSKSLYDLIRYLSKQRLTDISSRPVLSMEDHEHPDDFVYGSHQTIIQVASRDVRISFKSHFTLRSTQKLIERKNSVERTPRQILKSTYDLFMEYSNLVAGGISQQLHATGVVAGISLPMATSGFDELISSDEFRPMSFFDFWTISGEEFKFSCTVCVDFLDETWLDSFHFDESSIIVVQEDDDVEFL